MSRPVREPLGLHLTRVSRTISRVFDDALAEAGGSLPVWLVLISLKRGQLASQRELAEAVGVQGATLSHHLNAMESAVSQSCCVRLPVSVRFRMTASRSMFEV